jgi:malate dehydrogenase (oxaloacetate-decarboxylating)(NADP+)
MIAKDELERPKQPSSSSSRRQDALDYHSRGRPGKVQVVRPKPCATQSDLSLAYTPACRPLPGDPDGPGRPTAHLAVQPGWRVSNGTAGSGWAT